MDQDLTFEPTREWDDCGSEDPDSHSPRLRAYHQRLWSNRPLVGLDGDARWALQPLDTGLIDTALPMTFFGLEEGLFLKSDRVMPTWWNWSDTEPFRSDQPLLDRILASNPVLDNMGGTMLWPGRQVGGQTLNQARGFSQKATIGDRMDLTLECIRRAYEGTFAWDDNPLGPTLKNYWQFFELFGDFPGYVHFWMLPDLLSEDGRHVRSFMGGVLSDRDFPAQDPLPGSVEDYDTYLLNAQAFVLSRNDRMSQAWAASDASE